MRQPRNLPLLLLTILLIPGRAPAQEIWSLIGADFQSHAVTPLAIDPHGVKFTDSTSPEPQRAPWDQVLELDRSDTTVPGSPDPSTDFVLRLNGGDRITGVPDSIANDKVTWKQPLLGQLEISEDRVNAIVRAGQTPNALDQPRKADVVRLLNGDETTGVVQGIASGNVTITPAGADSPAHISLDKIAAILLADDAPLSPPKGRAFRIWLTDGSSLTSPLVTLLDSDPAHLLITLSAARTANVDLNAVSCIEQIGGPILWLTGLSPTSVVYHPYLQESFPPQFDHPVDDPAASIRDKFPPFHHGIGVHSYTLLTYAVPDGCRAFRTRYSIEKIPGADMLKADVTVRILLDGKIAREFPHVRYGSVAEAVDVDVSAAKELSLEVDYGDNLDAQDRFVWLDPAFVRASPTTQP